MPGHGELIVVGCGIQLGRHISQRGMSEILAAERLFVLADSLAYEWIVGQRPDAVDLTDYYDEATDRRSTYRLMSDLLFESVMSGQRTCAVFYGHPGVFAQVPHDAVRRVRASGGPARMEPGISAEACLYADLGLDPGDRGVQSLEATRFLTYRHPLDPSALVLLWQVALTGNLDCVGFEPNFKHLELLVEKLSNWYDRNATAILYEAAQLPIEAFRAERISLAELPMATFKEYTTLVIPPAIEAERDDEWLGRLKALD